VTSRSAGAVLDRSGIMIVTVAGWTVKPRPDEQEFIGVDHP
jgi:hypothetical protein